MEHFPGLMTEAQTESMIEGMEAHFEEHGYGLWALELNLTRAFIGFSGLSVPGFEAAFTPKGSLQQSPQAGPEPIRRRSVSTRLQDWGRLQWTDME